MHRYYVKKCLTHAQMLYRKCLPGSSRYLDADGSSVVTGSQLGSLRSGVRSEVRAERLGILVMPALHFLTRCSYFRPFLILGALFQAFRSLFCPSLPPRAPDRRPPCVSWTPRREDVPLRSERRPGVASRHSVLIVPSAFAGGRSAFKNEPGSP